jgi:hypothetical protein
VFNAAQLEEIDRTNNLFPDHLVPIGPEHWPTTSPTDSVPIGAFRSKAFVVIVWQELSGFQRLSINRTEWDEHEGRFRGDISWDDLQRLKSEAGFGDVSAVELYPPDGQVLNTANLRHLFLLTSAPAFMWRSGDLSR